MTKAKSQDGSYNGIGVERTRTGTKKMRNMTDRELEEKRQGCE